MWWSDASIKDMQELSGIMSLLLHDAESPPFVLKREVIPAGRVLRVYDPEKGRFHLYKTSEDTITMALRDTSTPTLWMNDTPMETTSMIPAIAGAHGKVLTSGLGIGLFVALIAKKPSVRSITVVEREQKIIDLVYPQIKGLFRIPFEVVCGDIYHYLKHVNKEYDFIFIDIWPGFLAPIKEMDSLKALAEKRLAPGGEVRVWLQELVERVKGKLPSGPVPASKFSLYREPCLICGKVLRNDYAGLCMDCADSLKLSELFIRRKDG